MYFEIKLGGMDRFSVSRVSDKTPKNRHVNNLRNEIALNIGELNGRRNSKTVPNLGDFDRRKFSLAQLTR